MSMMAALVIVIVLAFVSLALNATFIAHELGWFPHGKSRREPTVQRAVMSAGRLPSFEEARFNDDDYQTKGPLTDRWRRVAHPAAYRFQDAEAHLRRLADRFERHPSASSRDDVITVMNQISTASPVTGELARVVESVIATLNRVDIRQAKPQRSEE